MPATLPNPTSITAQFTSEYTKNAYTIPMTDVCCKPRYFNLGEKILTAFLFNSRQTDLKLY
ncbi:hypothetical protein OMCYN_00824 [cyanobiont of Ornithocercus magnificus]|nr:hypothetical protein OMCYN_00824 [cyanobiont of Ornithocercus magnificus]